MKKIILYIIAAGMALSMVPIFSMEMDERPDGANVYQQSAQERAQQEGEAREQQMRDAREAARADENLYEILGVESFATQEQITASYRKLARRLHPDRPNGNADEFARVNKAYEILSDKEVRSMYNRHYFLDGVADDIANAFTFTRPSEQTRQARAKGRREARKQSLKKRQDEQRLAQMQQRHAQSRLDQIRNHRFVQATQRRMRAMAQLARRRAYELSGATLAVAAAATPLLITNCQTVAQAYCAGAPVSDAAMQICAATLPSALACWTGSI